MEVAAAVIPPMLGTLMILLTYLLAKKLFGLRVALLSAFLLATDSKHIARTIFGFPDHDSLELLLIIGSLLLLSYALTERERKLAYGAAAGVLLAAVAYTWLGAPIYMVAILIYASIQTALDLRRGTPPKRRSSRWPPPSGRLFSCFCLSGMRSGSSLPSSEPSGLLPH